MTLPSLPIRSGATIPLLGFGTWQLSGPEAYDAVRAALEVGYRHLDTATVYRNEDQVGRALADSGVDRSEVFVTTKLPPDRAGPARQTLEASLHGLGVDAVDLWLIHWPPGGAGVDIWRQLLALRDEGLARDVGVSNYSPEQVDELVEATGEAPAVNQIRWSPWLHDADRLAHSRRRGVVLEGYSPFKASTLSDPVLREVADAHGVMPTQVILRWHVDSEVVVIPKSARRQRIEDNFAVDGFTLTADELARLDALSG